MPATIKKFLWGIAVFSRWTLAPGLPKDCPGTRKVASVVRIKALCQTFMAVVFRPLHPTNKCALPTAGQLPLCAHGDRFQ
jgi:hypothetical protein